jgi:hypothetical protein
MESEMAGIDTFWFHALAELRAGSDPEEDGKEDDAVPARDGQDPQAGSPCAMAPATLLTIRSARPFLIHAAIGILLVFRLVCLFKIAHIDVHGGNLGLAGKRELRGSTREPKAIEQFEGSFVPETCAVALLAQRTDSESGDRRDPRATPDAR